MESRTVDGRLIGTFDGKAGDQFQLMETKFDLLLRDSYVDPDTDERVYEITLRGYKPVDEYRLHLELPEHGYRKLVSELEAERGR